jgi:hypothetical protein
MLTLVFGATGLGLLVAWIALNVAEFAAEHPDIAAARGCRGGACKLS